jgi:tRNA (mo5U34)-methyltransferase
MDVEELRRLRRENGTRDELERLGWYHAFRFEDGTEFPGVLPVEVSQRRYSRFPIPDDLTGKRLLDIGAWDGWFSFEAERHGAQVTAIDMVEVENFHIAHRKLGSKVTYRECDLFEIPQAALGKFDYVFFLGVLYHTKHPLLALELVCGLTLDVAIVESYVTDAADWEKHRGDIPTLEFYEADELGGQLDNWCGPTVGCLIAMSRAAGFARVEVLETGNNRAALACYRRWGWFAGESGGKTKLRAVTNTIRRGINFRSGGDEYLTWSFEFAGDALHRDEVRLEVGGFGVPAIYVSALGGGLRSANTRLPPGMDAGWHEVRASVKGEAWSDPLRIAVDVPVHAEWIEIDVLCDGRTWARNTVDISSVPAHVSLWVRGLGENSDPANTAVALDGRRLTVTYVSQPDERGARQVNATLPAGVVEGEYGVTVKFAGVESKAAGLVARRE